MECHIHRLLKDDEVLDFQQLFGSLARKKEVAMTDSRRWSLDPRGRFFVKSPF